MLDLIEKGAVGLVDQMVALFHLEDEAAEQREHLRDGQEDEQDGQGYQQGSDDGVESGETLVLPFAGLFEGVVEYALDVGVQDVLGALRLDLFLFCQRFALFDLVGQSEQSGACGLESLLVDHAVVCFASLGTLGV